MSNRNIINRNLTTVSDLSFKYTKNEERKWFVANTYPFFNDLAQIPFAFDWHSYNYTGDAILALSEYDEDEDSDYHIFSHASVVAKYLDGERPHDCFNFFGGSAYEILHNAIKKRNLLGDPEIAEYMIPNIRELIDPTGDIDISVRRPYISYKAKDDFIDFDFEDYECTKLNSIMMHWTKWLFENVVKAYKESPARKGIAERTEIFDPQENGEIAGSTVLQSEIVDNVFICLLLEKTMVKVQIVGKFKGVSHSDHFFEMVIGLLTNIIPPPSNTAIASLAKFKISEQEAPDFLNKERDAHGYNLLTMDLQYIRIQSFYKLIDDNIDSIKNRFDFHDDDEYRHKFYNHVQRLRYLNAIFPYFVTDNKKDADSAPYLTYIKNSSVLAAFQRLIKFIKSYDTPDEYGIGIDNKICYFNYNYKKGDVCNPTLLFESLIGNIIPTFREMLKHVPKGIYPNINKMIHKSAEAKAVEKPKMSIAILKERRSRRGKGMRRQRRTRKYRRSV